MGFYKLVPCYQLFKFQSALVSTYTYVGLSAIPHFLFMPCSALTSIRPLTCLKQHLCLKCQYFYIVSYRRPEYLPYQCQHFCCCFFCCSSRPISNLLTFYNRNFKGIYTLSSICFCVFIILWLCCLERTAKWNIKTLNSAYVYHNRPDCAWNFLYMELGDTNNQASQPP